MRGTSNPDENVYFCEGENEKKTHENIFSWRYYLNRRENVYFCEGEKKALTKI